MDVAVKRFFDEFVDAFPSFSGDLIAGRYAAPYLAIRSDGSRALFSSHQAIADYFQEVVSDYRSRGCIGCRYFGLEVQSMGAGAALGTVSWALFSQAGVVLSSWRESYNLIQVDGELKACVSVDHAS
ncbi:hypothetical protein [Ottowia sp.]|uniref:hypothetical protein n=1 Tax=Ottowia sp. TaxID=1898956 RepID=UPI0039E4EA88